MANIKAAVKECAQAVKAGVGGVKLRDTWADVITRAKPCVHHSIDCEELIEITQAAPFAPIYVRLTYTPS